jgi:YbbR domain-containing protein
VTLAGFIRRNWRLKVGCFLIAFVTWVGVVYAGNPPETKVIQVPVPQSAANIPSAFVLVHQIQNLLVRVGGDQNTLATLNPAVLSVSVDWAAADRAGTYAIPISIVNTDPNIELIDPPTRIQVDLDAFVSVSVPVTIVVTNPPPVGYRPGAEQATPSTVAIDGPQHELAGVQARVTVDLSTQKANFQADLRVFAYDSKGNRLNNVGIDHTDVSVSIAIEADVTSRTVAVVPHTVGSVPSGHYLLGISSSPQTVLITGPQDLLNGIDSIQTSPVFLNGITGLYTVTITLVPPAGVTVTPNKVVITIEVAALPTPPPAPTPTPTPSPTT